LNANCPRCIFTERLPDVVEPWARRTKRLAQVQQEIGLMAGGTAGKHITRRLNMPASVHVLLRLMRRPAPSAAPTPRVLGIDDWAKRKGHTYGTILVDLETNQVVDLLPDRSAETVETWLRDHPGVEIISRDRAGAYAEGATKGAPEAVQVADRWHLLKNLGDALSRILGHHHRALKKLTALPDPLETAIASTITLEDIAQVVPPNSPAHTELQQQRREQRMARYQEVQQLYQRGLTLSAIAAQTGLDRKTVRKYAYADELPERQSSSRSGSILDPYKPYLLQRWNEGCWTSRHLLDEIRAQGYPGGLTTLITFLGHIRKAQGIPSRTRNVSGVHPSDQLESRPLTPRRAVWLILNRPDQLKAHDLELIEQIRQLHPDLAPAIPLAQAFSSIVREREVDRLDEWLDQAAQSSLAPMRGLAASLRRDYAAVKAAVSTNWSNGPVEGHINRLKFIKRQMYGRAGFDLIRLRVLFSP
jgi:transposase